MSDSDDLEPVRLELAERSHWNWGYFFAGFLFWVYVTITGAVLRIETARYYWLVGTFVIFPVAVLASRLIGADPFSRGNRLGELVGYTHMSTVSLGLPLVVAACVYYPEVMLLAMAVLYCIDFYVMSWAFGTPLFGIHALARIAAVSLIWFVWPEWRLPALPVVVAFSYGVTILLIPMLRRRWIRARQI